MTEACVQPRSEQAQWDRHLTHTLEVMWTKPVMGFWSSSDPLLFFEFSLRNGSKTQTMTTKFYKQVYRQSYL